MPEMMLARLTVGILLLALHMPAVAQQQPHTMFRDKVGLTAKEIAQVDSGQVFTKVIPSDDKLGLLVFGATYVNAPVEIWRRKRPNDDRFRARLLCPFDERRAG